MLDHRGRERVRDRLQGLEEKISGLCAADAPGGGEHLLLHAQIRVSEEGAHRGKVLRSAHLAEQADDGAEHVPGGIPVQLLEQDGGRRLARSAEQVQELPAGETVVVAHQVLQQEPGGRRAQGGEDAGRLVPVRPRLHGGCEQLVEERRYGYPFEQIADGGRQLVQLLRRQCLEDRVEQLAGRRCLGQAAEQPGEQAWFKSGQGAGQDLLIPGLPVRIHAAGESGEQGRGHGGEFLVAAGCGGRSQQAAGRVVGHLRGAGGSRYRADHRFVPAEGRAAATGNHDTVQAGPVDEHRQGLGRYPALGQAGEEQGEAGEVGPGQGGVQGETVDLQVEKQGDQPLDLRPGLVAVAQLLAADEQVLFDNREFDPVLAHRREQGAKGLLEEVDAVQRPGSGGRVEAHGAQGRVQPDREGQQEGVSCRGVGRRLGHCVLVVRRRAGRDGQPEGGRMLAQPALPRQGQGCACGPAAAGRTKRWRSRTAIRSCTGRPITLLQEPVMAATRKAPRPWIP